MECDSVITEKAERIRDVIRYIKRFNNTVVVIHLDDKLIESPLFVSHIRDICMIHDAGLKVLIVTGAKKRIDEVLSREQKKWQIYDGVRITSEDNMPLIKMAAFDVSNKVMTALAGERRTAVIGNWVKSRSRGVINGVDFESCGAIDKIQVDSIQTVLQNNFIPIFPCIGWSSSGKPYNIPSIELAYEVAVRMNAGKLFFLTNDSFISAKDFIIPEDVPLSPEGCIPAMNLEEVEQFIDLNSKEPDEISGRKSILKLLSIALDACNNGVTRVHILNGSIDGTMTCEIFSDLGSGTMIYKSNYGGIREMVQDDIPSVLNLIRPFIEKGILLNRTEEDLDAAYKDFIVYELDGGIRACASLHLYKDGQAEIGAVAVDSIYSHMGVGPKILSFLIDRAKKLKASSVFILTTQTADWFEAHGFVSDKIDTLPIERKTKWTKERNSKLFRLK